MTKEYITIRIDGPIKRALAEAAKAERRTLSQFVAMLVEAALEVWKAK